MPMIPVHSKSAENIGVLVIEQAVADAMVTELYEECGGGSKSIDVAWLSPTIVDGRITKFEITYHREDLGRTKTSTTGNNTN